MIMILLVSTCLHAFALCRLIPVVSPAVEFVGSILVRNRQEHRDILIINMGLHQHSLQRGHNAQHSIAQNTYTIPKGS